MQVCALALSTYLPLPVPLPRTRTDTRAPTQRIPAAVSAARSYSFTLQAVSRQLLECPDLKCTEIATIVSLTTKYQASESGLSDSQLLFIRVWGVQRPDHIEDWNHRGCVFKEDGMGWEGKKSSSIETLFFFIRGLDAKFIPDKDTCTGLRHGGQTEKMETLIKKN